ncbi:allantoin racemase [Celeribacter baekdonensis]|uniref:Allantoin racemase n=1 Tax=Celeribacter baekdonensis TaxID=875171 RepID=A0A1G7MD16_9RHOB|nr:allantoin racemase [Celeribacter baekdonensis]
MRAKGSKVKILFLNPNSSAHMTQSVVATARALLPEAEILGWTNADGPAAIQGPEDGAAAIPGLMALLPKAREEGVEAIVIACFDDTGLEALRAAAHCPVIGIGEAAYHFALLKGQTYGVVTTLGVSVPVIEGNIRRHGFEAACLAVSASGIAVLEVEEGRPEVLDHLTNEIKAMRARGAQTVILGCAGMSTHHGTLTKRSGVVLIDGVRAATLLAQVLVVDQHSV